MPNFNTKPPADGQSSGYRLIRTPPAHPVQGIVLSNNILGCNTHFVGNRTIPCESPECDACNSGISWRWHGYLLVLLDGTHEKVIFEMTARASVAFQAYFQRHSTLKGAQFKAVRLNQRPNGRVLINVRTADLDHIDLPKAPPLEKLLCHIWNIPENQAEKSNHKTRPPMDHGKINRSKPELAPSQHEPDTLPLYATPPLEQKGNNSPQSTG